MSLDDARMLLARAKDEYRRALRGVESKLRAAAAQSPDNLAAVAAVQEDYVTGFDDVAEPLGMPSQPPDPAPLPEPDPTLPDPTPTSEVTEPLPPPEAGPPTPRRAYEGDARPVAEGEEV